MLQYKLYCGWFEGFHIAIHCIVLQENQCIVIDIVLQEGLCCPKTVLQYSLLGSSVLQYTALYWGWKGCRKIVSQYTCCIVTMRDRRQGCTVSRGRPRYGHA